MRGEIQFLLYQPTGNSLLGNPGTMVPSGPLSPTTPNRMTRVATFPPDYDPEFVFPKLSSLKLSPTTSDSKLFYKVSTQSVLDASFTFQAKLNEFLAKLPPPCVSSSGVSALGPAAGSEESDLETLKVDVSSANKSGPADGGKKEHQNQVLVRRAISEVGPPRRKKSVHFADDQGKPLFTSTTACEPSDVPPTLKSEIVLKLLEKQFPSDASFANDRSRPKPTWSLDFPQPASDYARFRGRLQSDKVVLENVFIQPCLPGQQKSVPVSNLTSKSANTYFQNQNSRCRLLGTIRVSNLAFEKKVFVRITENNWISYTDHLASYSGSMKMLNYDTFCFDFEIPLDDDFHPRLSFCIGYSAGKDGGENGGQKVFWDNNSGANYSILSKRARELWAKTADADVSSGLETACDTSDTINNDEVFQDPTYKTARKPGVSSSGKIFFRAKPWISPNCGTDPYSLDPKCWSDFVAGSLQLGAEPYW